MSTTSTSKHAFTAGPAVVDGWLVRQDGHVIVTMQPKLRSGAAQISHAEVNANAELVAEAFTVAHETGLTPRQLAEQRKTLLAAAIKVRLWLSVERCDDPLKVIDDVLRSLGIADVPCPECEGAGEWDEGPLPASSSVQISPECRQVKCPECSGAGRVAIAKTGGAA